MSTFHLLDFGPLIPLQVYYWTTIRKMRKAYHASRSIREDQVTSILQRAVILDVNTSSAEDQLLALPALQRFLVNLKLEKEKDDFKRHLRRYINIYLPECPFEVASTNRYTITSHEACVIARQEIKKGTTIKYLCGVQVVMTTEEEAFIKHQRRDFSVVVSSRSKTASLFLGPARFANHDCGANARLMTNGLMGMDIIAARNIQIGEEITVTYGDNYFGEDNCECLCKTCEDNLVNGWQQAEGSTVPVKPSIEADSQTDILGPVTRRRRETATSSRTPSTAPELRPVVRKMSRKSLSGRMQSYLPTESHLSTPSPDMKPHDRKDPRSDVSTAKRESAYERRTRSARSVKSQVCDDRVEQELYSSQPGSPESTYESTVFSSVEDATTTSDPTSMDEEAANTPLPLRRGRGRPRKYPVNDSTKSAMSQVDAGNVIIVGPATDSAHPAVDTLVVQEDSTALEAKSTRKLKRPSTRLLTKTLSKIGRDARAAKKAAKVVSREASPEVLERCPGDYVLTPLLLAQPSSAWISCTICDEYFVQLDAYLTR